MDVPTDQAQRVHFTNPRRGKGRGAGQRPHAPLTTRPVVHTKREAAAQLRISYSLMQEKCKALKVKTVKIGSREMVSDAELQRIALEGLE